MQSHPIICAEPMCNRPVKSGGLCNMHYKRTRKGILVGPRGKVLSHTPEYRVWERIKQRCLNPRYVNFKNYGGRGIQMCERWQESFEAFLADVGPRPEGRYPSGHPMYSLDRIDNSGNYEPGNCRWTTMSIQNNNQRGRIGRRGRVPPHCPTCTCSHEAPSFSPEIASA